MQDSVKPGYAPSLMEHNKGDDFRFWVGTKEEYEAKKGTIPANTFCVITDDTTEADILAAIEKLSVDYIVESGQKDGWIYEKWSSGLCKLYKDIYHLPVKTGSVHFTIDYPFELARPMEPLIIMNIKRNPSVCDKIYPSNEAGNYTSPFTKMDVWLYDVKNTDFACFAVAEVIARWK
jgi:hypothetical protein